MTIKKILAVKTQAEAINAAIMYQSWQSKRSMSWSDVMKWHECFLSLAKKFNLKREFKENGII